jgi:hypothetical protein
VAYSRRGRHLDSPTMASDKAEFIFIDESGDPGFPGSNPIYILSAVHMNAAAFNSFRLHLASFR